MRLRHFINLHMLVEFGETENGISITSKKLISNKVLTKTLLTLKITTILTLRSFDGFRNDSATTKTKLASSGNESSFGA